MTILRIAFLLGFMAFPTASLADEPRPAITVQLDQPDHQIRAVIDLFRGSRAAHPAAALAAWKRASREPNRLGKPLEALIAVFNPEMAEEFGIFDGAELALWFDPDSDGPSWGATLPKDDGSFAALATALVLTDGAAEAPLDGLTVDRLGPPGSPLMAKGPRGLLVAGSTEGLKEARIRSDRPRQGGSSPRIRYAVAPASLDGSKSLAIRRLRTVLREVRGPITGSADLAGSTLNASLSVVGVDHPVRPASVEPSWLDWLPTDRTMAAIAVATDPTPANWDALFRVADQVEKVDPARENLAPLRLRLDLLARTLGLQADGDLLPHLKGVAGWLGGDGRTVDRACLTFHLDDEATAARVFDRIKPLLNSGPPPEARPGQSRWLGPVEGRALWLHRFGPSVVATWGDGVLAASIDARDHPERSARPVFKECLLGKPPAFLAAIWPARVPDLLPADTPLAHALAEARPVIWSGFWEKPSMFRLDGIWRELDVTVRRFLDRIPLDPPPDH
jgi:hypothetical protein